MITNNNDKKCICNTLNILLAITLNYSSSSSLKINKVTKAVTKTEWKMMTKLIEETFSIARISSHR